MLNKPVVYGHKVVNDFFADAIRNIAAEFKDPREAARLLDKHINYWAYTSASHFNIESEVYRASGKLRKIAMATAMAYYRERFQAFSLWAIRNGQSLRSLSCKLYKRKCRVVFPVQPVGNRLFMPFRSQSSPPITPKGRRRDLIGSHRKMVMIRWRKYSEKLDTNALHDLLSTGRKVRCMVLKEGWK